MAVCRSWELWESIRQEPSISCFSERDYAWRLPPGFSAHKVLQAGKLFEGEQVMGSFFKHTAREKRYEPISPTALKYIFHVGLSKGEAYSMENDIYDYYNVTIVAKSFVREQIRRMMSCLVNYSYDRIPLTTIEWLLSNPISSNFFDLGIPVAPPQGLFLTDVVYDPRMFTNPEPYFLHSWDYD
ncbi:tRNA pseudouridine synthase [Caenorhabditis elegans]|nr:tRNA pseudouridine synthase [Caenorhabditis elegans]CDK13506.1 tRNA pseudouridine synthase [Caenorhabditis elegans]|eukprot:NP_001293779.1 tRNA pseudouridine synthase [Caenorhabditis elegans]